ncbi:MAG TPA: sulfatase [Woeseiaceae bacterium]|nr:sulfatase [Woeseiaceae bacterium]
MTHPITPARARHPRLNLAISLAIVVAFAAAFMAPAEAGQKRPNVIFILTDDQRFDEIGLLNPLLETPHLDELAREGAFFRNAFVTTALCSPSRATILTGQYMHDHGIVDNNVGFREGTRFFPMYLDEAGYQTAFIGKWHMGGEGDAPQPGFDHWVSFAGQGHYLPEQGGPGGTMLNVDGERVPQKGYITDELTDYALDWLGRSERDAPFFLYLSHKAQHSEFTPAERHDDQYAGVDIPPPPSQANTPENYAGKPMWVKNQRNSWHGVDFPYHSTLDIEEYRRNYHRTLSAVDDSVGRLVAWLEEAGLADETLVIYASDNGFLFGEHGLIDKRNAYEESMRVPLIAWAPGLVAQPGERRQLVANLDIAPTILAAAGLPPPPQFSGRSFLPLIEAGPGDVPWRDELLYEYYWEYNFPHTPTTFALRTARYKLIQYHGVWDVEEFYDLESDPREMVNLIDSADHRERIEDMRRRLYEMLAAADGGHAIPYSRRDHGSAVLRSRDGAEAAEFPEKWLRP